MAPRDASPSVEPGQMYFELKYNVDGTQLQGNRSRSFLHEGINHTAEASFFSNVPVLSIRRLENLVVTRYTNNPRIDPERNSLQRFYLRLTGPSFEANLGDALVNYSRLTFNQNIKGLNAWKNLPARLRLTATVGFFTDRWGSLYRDFTAFRDVTLNCLSSPTPPGCGADSPGKPYSRLLGGLRLERKVGENGWLAASWSHGKDLLQSLPEATLVCENQSTGIRTVVPISAGCIAGEKEVPGARRPAVPGVNNDVLGVDTSYEWRPAHLRFKGEYAYSFTSGGTPPQGANFSNFACASQPPVFGAAVLDSRCFSGQVGDYAGRFEASERIRKLNWRVDYSRYQPNFFAANARQIRDLQDFTVRGDYEFIRQVTLVASWRRSNDNLNGRRDFTSIIRAPEVRVVFRDLPLYRRLSVEVGYRERNLETSGSPTPTELQKRSTRIPFLSVGLPIGRAQFSFDYEHRQDVNKIQPALSSDTGHYSFGYRGSYAWGGWDLSPYLRLELEHLSKNNPNQAALSPTDPSLFFPLDFFDAFDTNRSIQAGFLLDAPRYIRLEGQYREFNSVTLSALQASARLDPLQRTFFFNQGFRRPDWRAAVTFKIRNDENRTITAYYERTNNFFPTGDPFVPDVRSFRETVIGGTVVFRFRR